MLSLVLFLCGCSGRTQAADAPLSEICAEIAKAVAPEDAVILDADYMYLAHRLAQEDCRECAAFMVSRGSFPEEVILTRGTSEEAAGRTQAQLQMYLENILEQSRNYEPETYAMLQDCQMLSRGTYVCLFMTSERAAAEELFLSHIREYEPGTEPEFTTVPPAAPSPEPVSKPGPTAQPLPWGLVPETERAENSAFDGVIFVGNSVAGNLAEYVTAQRMTEDPDRMGEAVFYTAPAFTYRRAVAGLASGEIFPSIGGKSYEVADAVALTGAETVYLSMGFNDLANYPRDDISVTVDYVSQLIAKIREQNPDVTICILSLTPRIARYDHVGNYGNARIRELNEALLRWTEENQCYYIDCYSPLALEDGSLIPETYREYGDTDGIHLNTEGCRIWLDHLYTHTIS